MDKKATGPSRAPARPGISKWALVGPRGTCIRDATKKAAVTTETLGRSSLLVRRALQAASPALATYPPIVTVRGKTPSDICIVYSFRRAATKAATPNNPKI